MALKDFSNPADIFVSSIGEVGQKAAKTKEKLPKSSGEDNNPLQAENISQKISTSERIPPGYKANPRFIEKKSRRLQLLMQPSLYNKIKEIADKQRISVNECVHRMLENATEEEYCK